MGVSIGFVRRIMESKCWGWLGHRMIERGMLAAAAAGTIFIEQPAIMASKDYLRFPAADNNQDPTGR